MITKIKNSLDIFCTVLDNYGDAGVCLRLARDLSLKQFNVFLYCDDLKTLNTIKDKKDEENENLHIKKWDSALDAYNPSKYVIQAFSCRLCQNAIEKIKKNKVKVVNLEYLSAEKWIEEEKQRQQLAIDNQKKAEKIEQDKPKVIFADAVSTSQRSCLVAELAKILKQNGVNIGQNRLFDWLRKHGYLCSKGQYYNQPTQRAQELGLFEMKQTTINKPDGSILVSTTTKVTGKGQIYFVNKFLNNSNVGRAAV